MEPNQIVEHHDENQVLKSFPHSPSYKALLQAGPNLKPLQQVHANIIVSGSQKSRSLLTKLITLACAAGSIAYTRLLFLSIPRPDDFLFSSLIKSTSKFGFSHDAVFFYRQMLLFGISHSSYIFTSVIKACADLSDMQLGRVIHSHALLTGYGSDVYVQSALLTLYGKAGGLDVGKKLFDEMPQRTVVAWNSMISGYEQNGRSREAIGLFYEMKNSGFEPDSTTCVSVLSACSQLGALGIGCWVHDYIINKNFDVNVVLGTSLINMYTRCGSVRKAREVFDSMNEKNVISWTAMISGYGMHGYGDEAMKLFGEMRNCGPSPNNVTFVAVLSACAHAGLVEEGRRAFLCMRRDYGLVSGVEHRVCMVDMFGRAGLLHEAYQFIKGLLPGQVAPAVWTAMLGACKMHKNFDLGVEVAEHLLAADPENSGHYVSLSNIYALAGRMDRVEMVRNKMIRQHLRKQVGYTIIEINQETYLFSMGDKSHPETNIIYQFLDELMRRCSENGYVPVAESVMHEIEEEERELYALRYHSEKLAIAYGILKTNSGETIRIVKNLRMCEDCHSAIKYISVVADREIIVRDKLRFHCFKKGSCSCLDYW